MGFDFKSGNRNNWCRASNMKLIKLDYDPEICYFGSYYLEKFQLRIQQNSSSIIAFLAEIILEAPETTTDLRILR